MGFADLDASELDELVELIARGIAKELTKDETDVPRTTEAHQSGSSSS
jgi:hypothetical protein